MNKVTFSMKLMHLRAGLACKHYVTVQLDHFMYVRGYSRITALPKSTAVNSDRCKPAWLIICSVVINTEVRQDYLLFLLFCCFFFFSYKFNFIKS